MASILKNGRHLEIDGHFEFENIRFGLLDMKCITLLDSEVFLEFLFQEKSTFISTVQNWLPWKHAVFSECDKLHQLKLGLYFFEQLK